MSVADNVQSFKLNCRWMKIFDEPPQLCGEVIAGSWHTVYGACHELKLSLRVWSLN